MARLINFGTGDILDRLTILSLKLLYGEQAGKDTTHFRNERNVLVTKINAGRGFPVEHGLELAAVNAALWQAEDELREHRKLVEEKGGVPQAGAPFWEIAGRCAFRIQALNDRRSELITLINVNAGEHAGQEKVHGQSQSS